LHWFTDEDYFFPTSLPLVVECEWRNKIQKGTINEGDYYREDGKDISYSAVMYDFQKLLVSNAELRLMIFKLRQFEDLEYMQLYFEKAIEKYKPLQPGDKFLMVAYHEPNKQIYHIQFPI
jgi:hypothetical protein